MSYTETHFAHFKILTQSKEETEKYIQEHHLTNIFDVYYDDGEIDYIELREYENSKYETVAGGNYLIEYISHMHTEDEEGFHNAIDCKDGTYQIVSQFYNGGTCWDEILEETINKLNT